MLKIAYDPIYSHPLPAGHRFPMLKYELIPLQLKHEGIITDANLFSPARAEEESILRAHDPHYWAKLKTQSLSYHEERRIGFQMSPELVEREICIAQGTIEAALFASEYGVAFNVAGGTHHAGSDWGEGFCLLNDQAIAAHYLLHHQSASSVLIVDLDVHQGNGTAEIFNKNGRVFTLSVHGERNFPFRKEISDLDIGLPDGVQDEEYLEIVEDALKMAFSRAKPDFVFYLSGVDVLATDKLGKLSLSKEACRQRDEMVFKACLDLGIPVQVSMGGGYSVNIKDIVDAHCNTFKVANDLYF